MEEKSLVRSYEAGYHFGYQDGLKAGTKAGMSFAKTLERKPPLWRRLLLWLGGEYP